MGRKSARGERRDTHKGVGTASGGSGPQLFTGPAFMLALQFFSHSTAPVEQFFSSSSFTATARRSTLQLSGPKNTIKPVEKGLDI